MKYTFSFFFLFCLLSAQAQTRFYVHASATGFNTGQSWSDAFSNLQNALQTAQAGDEVWVAEGTYYPTDTLNRFACFEPKSGIKLFGGFAGNEFALAQRDWASHPSVLSGDIGQAGDSTDNCYNVMHLYRPDSNTVIDGFTIRDGNANRQGSNSFSRPLCGGGLYIDGYNSEAYPDILNCAFIHNTALTVGGGVMVWGAGTGSVAPRFINCRFEDNHALDDGGGMIRYGGSRVERGDDLKGCVFLRNRAGYQGGGYFYQDNERRDHLGIHGCRFEENVASNAGGGIYMSIGRGIPSGFSIVGTSFERNASHNGAALNVIQNNFLYVKSVLIDSCIFKNNIYINENNAILRTPINIQMFGGNNAQGSFKNSLIENNKEWRYTIFFSCSEIDFLFDNLVVKNNQGLINCIDLELANSEVFINNSRFIKNDFKNILLSHYGSSFFYNNCLFEKNSSNNAVAYIDQSAGNLNLVNCTFSNNHISLANLPSTAIKKATNCVLEDISNKAYFLATSNVREYSYCYFDNSPASGTGNISGVDPMFRDPTNGDYSLLPCSPLLNKGSNAAAAGIMTDINGAPRIQNGTVDIGAYEAPAFALAQSPEVLPACTNSPGGAISLDPANGCEPYTYTWNPPVGNGAEINEIPAGLYAVTITDGSGREISDVINVPTAPSPELTPLTQDITCGTLIGGKATATVASGTAPYSFQWSNQSTDSLLTMLPSGSYRVTVTDAHGCQDSVEMTINQSGQINLMVSGKVISCFGDEDGSLTAKAVNGKAPHSYLWSPQGATDSVLTGLGPGQYTVTATDFYGCTATFTFNLSNPPILNAVATTQPTSTLQNPNGLASAVFSSGGTQPYTYQWSNGQQSQIITGLAPGVYTVTITDANGCTATASAEVQFVSGTSEAEAIQVQVWPNPMTERLEIQALALPSGEYRFVLRDVLGREIAAEKVLNGRAVLSVSNLPSGVYSWELQQANGRVLGGGKVVK